MNTETRLVDTRSNHLDTRSAIVNVCNRDYKLMQYVRNNLQFFSFWIN